MQLRLKLRAINRRLGKPAVLIPCAFFGGLAVISAGVGLIYLPAGVIVAGVSMLGLAVLHEANTAARSDET